MAFFYENKHCISTFLFPLLPQEQPPDAQVNHLASLDVFIDIPPQMTLVQGQSFIPFLEVVD